MNKITPRDIQLFIAGGLALIGFRAVAALPYYLVNSDSFSIARTMSSLLTGSALPIGIALLIGRGSAITFAKVYLWLVVISACIVIPVYSHFVPTMSVRLWRSLPEAVVAGIMLALIYWSCSARFRHAPDA